LGAEGTDLTVQQRLMRHSDVRTTLSYGETDSEAMKAANTKVTRRAFDSGVIPTATTH